MVVQHPKVKKLFIEQAEYYSFGAQSAANSYITCMFLKWAKSRSLDPLKIIEYGGASGALLDKIIKNSRKDSEFYNAEIIEKYRKYQANPRIKFRLDSVLDSQFENNFFDVVIMRDVLHHLIGRNYNETRKNQKKALIEIKRVTRHGGIIFIEELVNVSALATKVIYTLSKFNSVIGLRSASFEINPYVIVAFLTPHGLLDMVKKVYGSKNLASNKYIPETQRWQDKITHIGAQSGKLILMIKR